MRLVIDIGNTAAKGAVFDGNKMIDICYMQSHELEMLCGFSSKYDLSSAIVSSVVDLKQRDYDILGKLGMEVVELNHRLPIPIENCYSTPETLGNDRLAAAVGANSLYPDSNILIIDAGTCITYDLVDCRNRYLGGNISPGLNMRMKALHEFTSRLPIVSPVGELLPMGNSTETAIRAGVVHGIEYEIQGYIEENRRKYKELFVFLTGGDLFSFDTSLKNSIFADKFLVLKGLNRILEYNEVI